MNLVTSAVISSESQTNIAADLRLARRQLLAGRLAIVAAALLGVVAILLWWQALKPNNTTVDLLTNISSLFAVVGTSVLLFLMLIITRWPVLERAFGQDHLVSWHKILGPWAVWLIGIHVVLIITSHAMARNAAWLAGLGRIIRHYSGIIPALVGLIIMITAGITSWRLARPRMRHESWWTVHLLTYLGVTLAFFHQVRAGHTFGDGMARRFWVIMYILVFGLLLWNRVLTPIIRSRRHGLVVSEVIRESDDVASIWMTGRNLDRLRLLPGQFLNFRFAYRGLSYEAHPFSISGSDGDRIRTTVKALGDGSTLLMQIPVGTKVTFEGPYGVMTPLRATGSRYVLVAGGVGIGPIVSLTNELIHHGVPLDVIYRTSVPEDLVLADELRALEAAGALKLHLMPGPRTVHSLDAEHFTSVLGDISDASVFVCGPNSLIKRVRDSATELGVPPARVHSELFDL